MTDQPKEDAADRVARELWERLYENVACVTQIRTFEGEEIPHQDEWEVNVLPLVATLIRKERADAWREGAEAMRELAALRLVSFDMPTTADAIRALPIPGGEHE